MNVMRVVLVLALATTVAACSYHPARISAEPPVIIDGGHGGHGNGSFCPPGQAKKGNC